MSLPEALADHARKLSRKALRRHLRFSVVNAANDNADPRGAA